MKLRTIASGLALAAGLALTLTPTGLASAAVKDGSASTVAQHSAATTKSEQQRIVDYWTPERMKSAVPVGSAKREARGKPGGGSSGGTAVLETVQQPRFGKVFFTCSTRSFTRSTTVREFSPLSIMAMPATISPSPSAVTAPCRTVAPVTISPRSRM